MLFRKSILSLIALFMSVSGMPVFAEQTPEPEVAERKDDTASSTEAESTLGVKKLYAEELAMLTKGTNFNAAIKTLAAGADKKYWAIDSLIQSINKPLTNS